MSKDVDFLVWAAMFEDKYSIKVTRTAPDRGELTVSEGENVLHRELVGLNFDGQSGPYIDDVIGWHEIAIRFVQKLERP